MNKNQKLAVGISSSFLVVILVVLSLVSSAGPSPAVIPVASNLGAPVCEARNDFHEYNPDTNSWSTKAELFSPEFVPGNRVSAVAFSIAAKGYITTGEYELNNATVYTKDLWEWNSATNVWTQKVSLPFEASARSGATGFAIGRRGYVGTGGNEFGGLKDFWEYDGDVDSDTYNTWKQKAPFGGVARTAATGFQLPHTSGNKGYIGTGIAQDGMKQDFWEWDQLTNKWIEKAPFGGGERTHAVGFNLSGKGYIGTGKSLSGYEKDFWQYDQASDSWIEKAPVGGEARISAVGFATDNYGYIGTGASLTGRKADFWEYNPNGGVNGLGSWTQKADYSRLDTTDPANPIVVPLPTDHAIGFSIRNTGYLGAGFRCEEEPPVACTPNSWTAKAPFGGSPRWFASGFSIGSKGYIGTSGTMADPKDFYEWDQATNTWTAKKDYEGTALHSASGFSIGNLGYIGTGTGPGPSYDKDFWAFDPSVLPDGDWIQKANLGEPATSTTLGRKDAIGVSMGGKGYIGTGLREDTNKMFKDFWEYNPTAGLNGLGAWTQKRDFRGGERFEAASFAIGDKIYVGSGRDLQNNAYKDFYVWNGDITDTNPVTGYNTWNKIKDFEGLARHAATGLTINVNGKDRGYVGTGGSYFQSNASYHDFFEYDPVANDWIPKEPYPGIAGFQAVGFSINGLGYIGTGYDFATGPAKDFYEYCPD